MASSARDALQTELKKKKICRFCLTQDPYNLTNIYMRDTRIKSSAPLPIQIMAIASIEVYSNDDMPCYVCSDCTSIFDFSYQFKQMCKKADNLLRQFPLTGVFPDCLDKPILQMKQTKQTIVTAMATPGKITKTTQVRMQHPHKTSVHQESLIMPKKILNSTVSSKIRVIDSDELAQSERNTDCTITFLDKIENNDELSLDDVHELVAAEDVNETEYANLDNTPISVVSENQNSKPKLLNKSSIRILNKNAHPENEPRLSFPVVNKDVDGKTEIVAEILNIDDMIGEPDPSNAAVIETNVFPCNYCERTFPLLQLRDIHMKNHLRDRSFQCEYCEKAFFSKYDLQRHLFIHNGEKPYKCSVCEQGFSRSSLLSRHEKTHTDVPKHICVHCERQFLSKEDMEKHVARHKINRPFVCKICNKGFAFKQGLERHEVIHSRQQPYSCQYCNESFSTTSKLSRHLTAHAGLRPYPCKYCKKSYLLSHHLTRHLRSHKNVDDPVNAISFMCVRCNTNFGTRNELITHSATHASEMNLECPLCKDVFNNVSDLTSHIQNHSEGEAYACEFCDLIFMTAGKLQAHTDVDHEHEMEAYHADDLAQANLQKEDSKNQKDLLEIADEKIQKTINEFLCDELPGEENGSDNTLKINIKKEKETKSPKIINQLIIKKDETEDNESLLIPLKQRKLDLADGKLSVQSKSSQRTPQTSVLKRKMPSTRGTSVATSYSNQPSIQSLLKFPKGVTASKTTSTTSKETPIKKLPTKTSPLPKISPQSKTSPSKTSPIPKGSPPSRTLLSKKVVLTNLMPAPKIKTENEHSEASSPSTSVDDILKMNSDKKKGNVQRITVTKSQAAAMAREGRIKIKDGKIILKK